jgi:magnesium chelatase accessory protein
MSIPDLAPDLPPDWPHRAASRMIACPPNRWHVQIMGTGPDLLLLHGAGASTHSWRGLMPILARTHRVIAPDLPGHGWTRSGAKGRADMAPMAEDLMTLCTAEGWQPTAIIGHSAGAVVALQMALIRPVPVIGINAALGAFEGLAGWLFPALARVLTYAPFLPQVFSRLSASRARVSSLLASTGSPLDAKGVELYRRLVARPDHVAGTLAMMAEWRLAPLLEALPDLTSPVLLITSDRDRAVPPDTSARAATRIPGARLLNLPGHGHLVHEEVPDQVAKAVLDFLK